MPISQYLAAIGPQWGATKATAHNIAGYLAELLQRGDAVRVELRPGQLIILSGILHCPCGSHMIGTSDSTFGNQYYVCADYAKLRGCPADPVKRYWMKEPVETRALEILGLDMTSGEVESLLDAVNRRLQEEFRRGDQKAELLEAEIAEIRRAIGNLLDAIEATGLGADSSIGERLRAHEEWLRELEAQREELVAGSGTTPRMSYQDLKSVLGDIHSHIQTSSEPWQLRHAIRRIVKRIDMDEAGKLAIRYKLPTYI